MLGVHTLGVLMYHITKLPYKFHSHLKKAKTVSFPLLHSTKSKEYKSEISILNTLQDYIVEKLNENMNKNKLIISMIN